LCGALIYEEKKELRNGQVRDRRNAYVLVELYWAARRDFDFAFPSGLL